MKPTKNIQLIKQTYNKVARKYNEIVEDNLSYPKHLDFLIPHLNPNSKVLDIGCGTGEAMKYLIRQDLKCTGVDFSDAMLNIAKKRFPKGNFLKMDFTKEKIPGNYDAFIAYFSLIYTPHEQLPLLLNKLSHNLVKGGYFQIAMLSGDSSGIDYNFWGTGEPMYFISYTEKELEDIVKKLGFRLLDLTTDINKYKDIKETTIYLTGRIPYPKTLFNLL